MKTMLYHYHGGTGTQYLGDPDSAWRVSYPEIIGITEYSLTVDALFWMDGRDEYVVADLYFWGDEITGLRGVSETANSFTVGDFPLTLNQFFNLSITASEWNLEQSFMSGQDVVDGSSEGGSLNVWTHSSDDYIRLHTGTANYADAGSGNDYLQNWTWHSDGTYLGGSGNDVFSVADGQLWGGTGADTFQLVPIYTKSAGPYDYAWIRDFEVGVDTVTSNGSNVYYTVNEYGLWIGAVGGTYSMLVSGVYDFDQINFRQSL